MRLTVTNRVVRARGCGLAFLAAFVFQARAAALDDVPAVVQALLDHYIERKCRSNWVSLPTLVSAVTIKPDMGYRQAMPASELGPIPVDLVATLSGVQEGSEIELPPQLYFPFRAASASDLDAVKTYSTYTGRFHVDWRKFESQNVRGGIIQFSEPVFDERRESAVVYMSHICGDLCAEGVLLYLRKTGPRWSIVRELPLWIS